MQRITQYETLIEAWHAQAGARPDATAVVLLQDDGARLTISRGALVREAERFGRALQAQGVRADDVVILVLPHSPELIYAFVGAIELGAVPSIFTYLTEKLDPDIYRQRVRALVLEAGARAVVTFPEFREPLAALLDGAGCRVLSYEQVASAGGELELPPAPFDAAKLAFLQYTSGTTGLHKGVALTHGALLRHVDMRAQAFQLTGSDVVVSWLPLYHDMGLISGLVTPLVMGIPTVLMSPFRWVREPVVLFRALHEFRGTLCWMPNFAFQYSVRAIRERDLEGLDLRAVRAVVNGAEPVRADTLESFGKRFAPYGLSPLALKSAYGMAELVQTATLCPLEESPRVDWIEREAFQTLGRAVPTGRGAGDSLPVVSCGVPLAGTQVRIVDPDRCDLPDRRIGEIALHSTAMLTEYYHRPEVTAQALADGWFYSGDLGYLAGGQLYVCGRNKDLIISAGRNIYPEDVEAIANTTPGVYAGRAVAFGRMDPELGSERVYLVCELRPGPDSGDALAVERELRRRVVRALDIALADVRLVSKGWVIKTSNGKLARAANRAKYESEPARGAA